MTNSKNDTKSLKNMKSPNIQNRAMSGKQLIKDISVYNFIKQSTSYNVVKAFNPVNSQYTDKSYMDNYNSLDLKGKLQIKEK